MASQSRTPLTSVMKHVPSLRLHAESQDCCSVCPLAKQSRLKFSISTTRAHSAFQLIHVDVRGPFQVPTYDRKLYFVTIVDDFSRYTWTYLIQSKVEVIVVLKYFLLRLKKQFAVCVKIIRSDNGKEFFNSQCNALFSSLGIIHQSCCPYTPQQNGVVAIKHRHILEVARAFMFQSGVPHKFWGDCVLTAVYLINKLPSSVLLGRSPYELLHKKSVVLDHLKVFGCLCFAIMLPRGDKFALRARKAVFLGYMDTQKGYKMFDTDSGTFLVSRDVVFHETIFPFKRGQKR